jgi:hypothetical protein
MPPRATRDALLQGTAGRSRKIAAFFLQARLLPAFTMDASIDAEVTALRAAARTATHVRELAQARIVEAFREFLCGAGQGPTESDLQSFARLALVERALEKHLGSFMAWSAVH